VKANQGAAGVDGQLVADFEANPSNCWRKIEMSTRAQGRNDTPVGGATLRENAITQFLKQPCARHRSPVVPIASARRHLAAFRRPDRPGASARHCRRRSVTSAIGNGRSMTATDSDKTCAARSQPDRH
jgi:hypothetical protein